MLPMIQINWIKRSYTVKLKRTSFWGKKRSISSMEVDNSSSFWFCDRMARDQNWQAGGKFRFGWFVCVCFRFIILGVFFFILQDNISKLTAVVIKTRSSRTMSFQKRVLSHIKHITSLLPHKKKYNVPCIILGLVHTTAEIFENTALFLQLGLQSTLIRHPKRAFQNVLQTGEIWKPRFVF